MHLFLIPNPVFKIIFICNFKGLDFICKAFKCMFVLLQLLRLRTVPGTAAGATPEAPPADGRRPGAGGCEGGGPPQASQPTPRYPDAPQPAQGVQ